MNMNIVFLKMANSKESVFKTFEDVIKTVPSRKKRNRPNNKRLA